MYKTISNKIIREFKPYNDPSKVITDENEELPIKDWVQKYRKVVHAKNILWLLLRKEFLSEKDLRLFAIWCARETLKLVENPDERIVEACNVAEKFANGEATQKDLYIAYDAALNAALYVYNDVSDAAFYADSITLDAVADKADIALAADRAASTAAAYAAYVAYGVAYVASISDFYASDAFNDALATSRAVYDATCTSQLNQLLTYF
jgi:hypothetical protein